MSEFEKVYITTPLFYPSNKPHLGHAFSAVIADVIKRYYELLGKDVWLVMGADVHGEKIMKSAEQKFRNLDAFIFENVQTFLTLWKKLNISYDAFIETKDPIHKKLVQSVFTELYNKKKIYLDYWRGKYCVSCEESHVIKNENKDDKCPLGHDLIEKKEESCFLKVPKNALWIGNMYKEQEDLVSPTFYKNDIFNNFLIDLKDLSVTRKNLSWGIKSVEHEDMTIYVWFDALIAYISADKNKWWNNEDTKIVQIIGKDILRFHSIYWPIILKGMKKKMFSKLICHGWLLVEEQKMSKSLGNVINPMDLLTLYSSDLIRFFLINLNWDDDNKFVQENIHVANDTYLSNIFGNVVSRFFGIIKKNGFALKNINKKIENLLLFDLNQKVEEFIGNAPSLICSENIKGLLDEMFGLLRNLNKFIDEIALWTIDINDPLFQNIVISIYRLIALSAFTFSPVLIDKCNELFFILDLEKPTSFTYFLDLKNFSNKRFRENKNILFSRYKDSKNSSDK